MKRWLRWVLVLAAALPGALVLFLWVTGFDANPTAAATPQWIFYIPLFLPLLAVLGIYGAGWIAGRVRGQAIWRGWVRALVDLTAAAVGALVAYGAILGAIYWGLQGSNPAHLGYLSGTCAAADGSVGPWLGWFFCLLGMPLSWLALLPPILVGAWAVDRMGIQGNG